MGSYELWAQSLATDILKVHHCLGVPTRLDACQKSSKHNLHPKWCGDFHGGEAQYGIPIRKKKPPSKKNKSKWISHKDEKTSPNVLSPKQTTPLGRAKESTYQNKSKPFKSKQMVFLSAVPLRGLVGSRGMALPSWHGETAGPAGELQC